MTFKQLRVVLLLVILGACSSPNNSTSTVAHVEPPALSRSEYEKLIENNTGSMEKNSGVYNSFKIYSTILNSKVQVAQLDRTAELNLWDTPRKRVERDKIFQTITKEAQFHLAMFTPEFENNDLNKPNSIWHPVLVVDGVKYEGKAVKSKLKQTQLRDYFPFHTRFTVGYDITFQIPMSTIERKVSHLILSSPLGVADLEFKPIE